MRVFVYFNLHKKVWSVRALEGPDKGRVIQHVSSLVLTQCAFKVSEAGRHRVLREKQKNVHAGIVGTLVDTLPVGLEVTHRLTYNPYRFATFVDADTLEPVHAAACVSFENRTVMARD